MTVIPERVDLLDFTVLDKGAHEGPDDGACILEAVSWVAGEPWSDHPACASPVIAEFLRTWNDNLDDGPRQDLKQHITRLVGSAGTSEQEDTRAWMALDWLIRTYTPAWLVRADLSEQATALAGLPEFTAGTDMSTVRPVIDRARRDAGDVEAAAETAWNNLYQGRNAGTAASVAASVAVRATAGVAAGHAAPEISRIGDDEADTLEEPAVWTAIEAAFAAAGAAAIRAVAVAAIRVPETAAPAATKAAQASLEPTVTILQGSAHHQLVDRMLTVTELEGTPS